MSGLVIQAYWEDRICGWLEAGKGRSFVTDSESSLAYWSHMYCKTYVAMDEVWENPISLRELLVHLEVPGYGNFRK